MPLKMYDDSQTRIMAPFRATMLAYSLCLVVRFKAFEHKLRQLGNPAKT